MNQRIEFSNRLDDFKDWFIIAAICRHEEKRKEYRDTVEADKKHWDIEFKIDGVDIDFVGGLERMKEELDRRVEEGALEMFKKKYTEASNEAWDTFYGFIDLMKEKYPELKEDR